MPPAARRLHLWHSACTIPCILFSCHCSTRFCGAPSLCACSDANWGVVEARCRGAARSQRHTHPACCVRRARPAGNACDQFVCRRHSCVAGPSNPAGPSRPENNEGPMKGGDVAEPQTCSPVFAAQRIEMQRPAGAKGWSGAAATLPEQQLSGGRRGLAFLSLGGARTWTVQAIQAALGPMGGVTVPRRRCRRATSQAAAKAQLIAGGQPMQLANSCLIVKCN